MPGSSARPARPARGGAGGAPPAGALRGAQPALMLLAVSLYRVSPGSRLHVPARDLGTKALDWLSHQPNVVLHRDLWAEDTFWNIKPYLLEQMRQFADGRRRNEFMEGMIRAMNSDEKIGMVLFYAAQEVTHKPATNAALAGKGQEYYGKICFRCHGNVGRGNELIARIAGQQADYLRVTLKRYRDGTDVRANSIMTPNTKNMTDADIEAVVAYVSSMP